MSTLIAIRIIFILGIINLAAGALVFLSCRCLPGAPIGKMLMKYRWYQRYYKWHCYIWWVFWVSVAIHAVFGLVYIGWPA